ncbi:aspartic proteinase CDR1-like [Nymphaea colorata]|uniref:Peptidase A1 domain-containing protein n=1 Tax=Nymphaea colorata TaxID=210225 RepID=A0A5K1DHY9_9MAGN|nr:aspartic proteinase CDR1-like [Nymphaea colorata]
MAATFLTILLSLLLLLQSSPTYSIRSHAQKGFVLDLIHRDSPSSPLHDPISTLSDRLRHSAERSFSRFAHLSSRTSAASNGTMAMRVRPGLGEYLVKLGIGTPAVEYLMIIDTGSDLIWTQCLPCQKCFRQPSHIFDPRNSSTFENLGCNSSLCSMVGRCNLRKQCQYAYDYGDHSFTKGIMASETLAFEVNSGQSIKVPNISFGCGHKNGGTFYGDGAAGILGLGGGPLSLISQLGSSVDYKFSYCLTWPQSNSSSSLKFGASAEPPATVRHVVKTPLVKPSEADTGYYYLALKDISVGKKKLNVPAGTFEPTPTGDGGAIIDSGTTNTLLTSKAYSLLEAALKSAVKLPPVTSPVDYLDLCFSFVDDNELDRLPNVTLHLEGGDWLLSPANAFAVAGKGVICSTFVPVSQPLTIVGSRAQVDVYVEYDLKKRVLSIAPTDCSMSG